ncbi:MAG: TPM domain-containing protein [Clostridia bacterium]|nr:TPM domain-containing protein [Clostridia bacterium]
MKKRVFAFFLLIAFLVMPALALASGGENAYIIDERGKLSATEIEQLTEKAKLIEAEQGFTPMFAIAENAGGNVKAYLEKLYTENNGGENGLILGYSNVENKWSAAAFGLAVDSFTESDFDALWDAYNNTDTYYAGVAAYLDSASRLYAQRAGGTVPEDIANATAVPTSAPVTAEPAGEPAAHVVDLAGLLSDSEENTLREKLESISAKHNCDVVVVTVNSTGNKTPMQFADDYQDYNGYKRDGILLLISMAERDWWVTTKGTGITAVTKDALDKIENDIVSDLSGRRYASAFSTFGDLCDDFLTAAENGEPYKKPKEPVIPTAIAAIGSVVVGLISGGSAAGGMASKLKSVHHKYNASDYVEKGSLRMTDQSEMFLYTNVIKTERPRDNDRGSGGGGGVHISSSGSSHGGGGGKF